MKIISFIKKETQVSIPKIVLTASISGVSGGVLLALVNVAAEQVANSSIEMYLFAFYMIILLIHLASQRYAQRRSIAAIEKALQEVRLRITNKVRSAELRFIENNNDIGSYTALSHSGNMITNAVISLVLVTESVLLMIVTGIYLAWLSPLTLAVTLLTLGFVVPLYISHYHKTVEDLDNAGSYESKFFNNLHSIIKGFKELKVNRKESDDLFDDMKGFSQETEKYRVRSNLRLMDDLMFTTISMYIFLMLAVFIIPQFVPEQSSTVYKISATLLFLMNPISVFSYALPNLTKTDSAVNSIYDLEAQVDSAQNQGYELSNDEEKIEFNEIRMEDMIFHYKDNDDKIQFSSGPINLKINTGELIFITGSNGSGKSTFLKLLTGLYHADEGSLYLNGDFIDAQSYPLYRSIFSLVFTDFHLFDKAYGLSEVEPKIVNNWLRKMGLEKKTQYINGKFTNTDLSTGQRKRLAFIIAVLKNKPICIFDELAADQDPSFRRRFYKDILPSLKAEGRTIFVVTHDEMYFDCCDRIIKLQDGQIVDDTRLDLVDIAT